jgi:hypothetical protein
MHQIRVPKALPTPPTLYRIKGLGYRGFDQAFSSAGLRLEIANLRASSIRGGGFREFFETSEK